jgi:hypothetical protein
MAQYLGEQHAAAKQMIAEIEATQPRQRLFEAKVKVLGEYVRHHIREEETELFPRLEASDLNLRELGEGLLEMKLALLNELGPKWREAA